MCMPIPYSDISIHTKYVLNIPTFLFHLSPIYLLRLHIFASLPTLKASLAKIANTHKISIFNQAAN